MNVANELSASIDRLGYSDPDCVKLDVENVLFAVPSLSLFTDVFVFNNGSTHKLLKLTGTLPIVVEGSHYNTPVDVWLALDYPHSPPKVFVRPTSSMVLRSDHPSVSGQTGECEHAYLKTWTDEKNLATMAHVLSEAFSENPPLYSSSSSIKPPPKYPSLVEPPPKYDVRQRVEDRLKKRMIAFLKDSKGSLARESQKASRLDSNFKKIKDDTTIIESFESRLTVATSDVQLKLRALENASKKKASKMPNVHSESELDEQMLELTSEILAVEDALFYLDKAFDAELMDLRTFMKLVRRLSREAFLKAVLERKVEAALGR